MDEEPGSLEETVVTHDASLPIGRLIGAIAMVLLGLGAIALGVLVISPIALRVIFVLAGFWFVYMFGGVALGVMKIGGAVKSDGVQGSMELPHTVKTTVRKRGFPRKGVPPARHGESPARGARRPKPPGPGSGASG